MARSSRSIVETVLIPTFVKRYCNESADKSATAIYYEIVIKTVNNTEWRSFRRYREFHDFDKKLKEYNFMVPSVLPPKTPLKSFINKITGSFARPHSKEASLGLSDEEQRSLEGRRADLERYCKSLVKFYSKDVSFWNHPIVLSFFSMEPINRLPTPEALSMTARPQMRKSYAAAAKDSRTTSPSSEGTVPASNDENPTSAASPQELLQTQKDALLQQDQDLEKISVVVGSQKQISQRIFQEVNEQNDLLSGIDSKLGKISNNIEKNESKIVRHIL